jgi:ribulose 1,5-bisphosphate synthetase/thiazole synthase
LKYLKAKNMSKTLSSILLSIVINFAAMQVAESSETYDIVIYGGTSAGVSAGIQAKRMGKTVIIVCPEKHLGGLTAGGLGWTDSGRKEAIGSISREFYQRIKKHYDKAEAWIYQKPHEYFRR